MKRLLILPCLVFCGILPLQGEEAPAIPVISPEEAAQHEGKTVTVKGKVDGQRTAASGSSFLNFGGRHPNQVFSCRAVKDKFPEGLPACEGKTVEVTGKIKMIDGKPAMDLQKPDQLKILEAEPAAEAPAP